jgi:hypothetical protein
MALKGFIAFLLYAGHFALTSMVLKMMRFSAS